MADEARIEIKPRAAVTHQELLIDFIDFEPDVEFSVNVTGPNPQPYWAQFKADPTGRAQLFWRTQAPGDYTVKVAGKDGEGKKFTQSEKFTVRRQAGEIYDEDVVDADVKSVEEPGRMGDTPSGEMRADPYDPELERPEQVDPSFEPAREGDAPEPRARRKSDSSRKGK
jgi:hypothetical protein